MDRCCSGVILAGGLSSRFEGLDKAFFDFGGRPLISRVSDLFCQMFAETMVVTSDPLRHLQWNACLFGDLFPLKSSLTGIHTGLFYAQTPWIFVAPCDTPFLRKAVVELVLSEIEQGAAAVMPQTPAGLEPLCAAYSKNILPVVEQHVKTEKFKIQRVFKKQKIKRIPSERIMEADPELESFFNINTAADLEAARARLDKKEGEQGQGEPQDTRRRFNGS